MLNFNDCDPRLLDITSEVIDDLVDRLALDADRFLLVGAGCRNAIHSALGHQFSLRGTSDADIGIALTDWLDFERIDAAYTRLGSTGIRFRIAGMAVDVMPFGGVENPNGVVTPETRKQDVSVFGFEDIYENSGRITLPGGRVIRIPFPAGYAALKMRAWIDRSAYGEYKDASDLAVVSYWYRNSKVVMDSIWDSELETGLLESCGYDDELAAMTVLSRDIARQLTTENCVDLQRRWRRTDHNLLARHFFTTETGPSEMDRRHALIARIGMILG